MLSQRSKFNTPTDQSNFLKNFHTLLLERLNMIQDGSYSKEKMDKLISSVTGTKATSMRMDIDPIQISVDLEPRLYWIIQETVKKITGNVMPMDEVVRLLLTYFVRVYADFKEGETLLPFTPVKRSKPKPKLDLFKVKFGRFFKNHIPDLQEKLDSGGQDHVA
jgi:hypothetical protein